MRIRVVNYIASGLIALGILNVTYEAITSREVGLTHLIIALCMGAAGWVLVGWVSAQWIKSQEFADKQLHEKVRILNELDRLTATLPPIEQAWPPLTNKREA